MDHVPNLIFNNFIFDLVKESFNYIFILYFYLLKEYIYIISLYNSYKEKKNLISKIRKKLNNNNIILSFILTITK